MKEHVLLSDNIYKYLLDTTLRETKEQRELRELTNKEVDHSFMLTAPDQVQFITLLVELLGVKRAIEVGVYTGYSSLAIALALPSDGELIACDLGADWPAIGMPFWQRAGVEHKIQLRIGHAVNTLQDLIADTSSSPFDFIFIDADKINYSKYYELGLQLLRPGGVILFDNIIRISDTFVYRKDRPATRGVNALLETLHYDERVSISTIPIGGGMLLARKRCL